MWPFYSHALTISGASPGRIQVFKSGVKKLLEVKSIFSKGNLQPSVEVAGKYYAKNNLLKLSNARTVSFSMIGTV